jgi:hypothetical protein
MLKTAIIGTLAIILLGVVFVPRASAQCAFPAWNKTRTGVIELRTWGGAGELRPGSFLLASNQEGSGAGIVGFWKVKFVSEGTPGIPDGTVLDNGFAQWHDDGTEIMNSSRVPATGNFCLGVWQKSGSRYDLNHFGLSFDPAGNFVGPARIQEHVTVNGKGDQYEGTFTIDQYDPSGNPIVHLEGQVTAKRVGVNTPVGDVL